LLENDYKGAGAMNQGDSAEPGRKMPTMVLARVKAFEELPPEALCCQGAKEFCRRHAGKKTVVAFPRETWLADAQCRFCGRIHERVRMMKAEKPYNAPYIDQFDLDEAAL
jgi:hypothetical protein